MTAEEHRLMQEIIKDHPMRPFYDGPRKEHKLLPAREAIQLLKESAAESDGRQLQMHADGTIW